VLLHIILRPRPALAKMGLETRPRPSVEQARRQDFGAGEATNQKGGHIFKIQ